jgi:hypothetical protein
MSYENFWSQLEKYVESFDKDLPTLLHDICGWDTLLPAYQFKNNTHYQIPINVVNEGITKTVSGLKALELKNNSIINSLTAQINSETEVFIDLGGGFGRNTYVSYLHFHDIYPNLKFIMGEYTLAGQQVCSKIIKKYNLPIESIRFDFNNWENLISLIKERKYNNICFLTNHSIEQVRYLNENFFKDLINIKSISLSFTHIEPVGFQMENGKEGDRRYNQNLIQLLHELKKENQIEITTENPDWYCFDGGLHNTASLIQWIKK